MRIKVGLDIGGSTTKVVGFADKKILSTALVRASDPVASAYGAFGKFISTNQLSLDDIDEIYMTGVGASYLNYQIFDRPTQAVGEFLSVGLGGLYISGQSEGIIVSIGTGTSIVYAKDQAVEHIIGSGVGGGTLLGLANKMINVRDFDLINKMAEAGQLTEIDLNISDITQGEIPGLKPETTASNFGKTKDSASANDLAKGIVNLVFQSVGTASILASRLKGTNKIIVVGSATRIHEAKKVFADFAQLYKVQIEMPEQSEYATAIGAALSSNLHKN